MKHEGANRMGKQDEKVIYDEFLTVLLNSGGEVRTAGDIAQALRRPVTHKESFDARKTPFRFAEMFDLWERRGRRLFLLKGYALDSGRLQM